MYLALMRFVDPELTEPVLLISLLITMACVPTKQRSSFPRTFREFDWQKDNSSLDWSMQPVALLRI